MTSINPAMALGILASPQTLAAGMQLQVAAGVLGQYMNPLGAPRFAFGQFPPMFSIGCFCGLSGGNRMPAAPLAGMPSLGLAEPAAQWTAQLTGKSTANIDLGDGYTLQLDERNSEIFIKNANTGETTRIWGDPHVDVDGKRAFDFWGTTTFTLENGTKITINTEQYGKNPAEYVSSQVVITKGDNAIVVDGISQNQIGDLSVSMSQNGQLVDAMARDGFTLHENATGSSWRSEFTGQVATQADLNATRVGAEYGPGSDTPSLGESVDFMAGFLALGMLSLGLGQDRRFG